MNLLKKMTVDPIQKCYPVLPSATSHMVDWSVTKPFPQPNLSYGELDSW